MKTEKNKQTAEHTNFIKTCRRVPHLVLILLVDKVCAMTGRVNWNPGKSRNAADKTTAGLKDFQRQLRDSGGFRNNKRVKLGIQVEVQRIKRSPDRRRRNIVN